ncbi:MAG: hypothetical protein ABI091_14795 [Ferruginibacter sp.]
MSFTDRFISLPVKIYDKREKDLTGKENLEESFEKILPFEISNYRKTYDGEDNYDVVNVELKNGGSLLVYLSIEEFEKTINDFVDSNSK